MTFCRVLKKAHTDKGFTIEAQELTEKFSALPYYEIQVYREDNDGFGIVYETAKTAATTWRRKFKQLFAEYSI